MKLKLFIFIILLLIFSKTQAYASEPLSRPSAILASSMEQEKDDQRVKTLKSFLERYNSPLASYSQVFVDEADRYNIDWTMVAAISGVESTFGQAIPAGSYNAWGWGVYGNHVTYFSSWEDGITTISQGIRERYMNQRGAQNVYQIGSTYAASQTWAVRVESYMEQISNFTMLDTSDGLSISL